MFVVLCVVCAVCCGVPVGVVATGCVSRMGNVILRMRGRSSRYNPDIAITMNAIIDM